MDFFSKSLAELTINDIKWLVDSSIREMSDLEFKAFPSTVTGKDNPWIKSDGTITRECKETLLKELVAFANAGGGTLVFGVSDEESRASGITPVPKAEGCAERLKLICRDSIEPAIPQIEVQVIPVPEANGAGVIVFRVNGPSPMGPHRSKVDKEFYVRRNERSEPMTVDEIRRYSIDLQRRLESVKEKLELHKTKFESVSNKLTEPAFYFSAYFVPTNEIYIPYLHRNIPAKLQLEVIPLLNLGSLACGVLAHNSPRWRPLVRGSEGRSEESDGSFLSIKQFENGDVSLELSQKLWAENAYTIPLGWIIGLFANALLTCVRTQRAASLPMVEYTGQFHLALGNGVYYLENYSARESLLSRLGKITSPLFSFPPITFNTSDNLSDVCLVFERDVLNLVQKEQEQKTSFLDFSAALNRIDIDFANYLGK